MNQLTLFEADKPGDTFSQICDSVGCEGNAPGWPDEFGRKIRSYLKNESIPTIRTLSLFSGAGGLDIGFSDVGFDIQESVEIEKKFCQTLELNSGKGKRFADSKVNCIDIRDYDASHLGKIDFIIGGPPCQTFSAAGRRANGVLGTTDARGVLFREYVRILKELSPVGFLFENVYGIVGAQGGGPWQEILSSFSEAGYKLFYRILDAADYGVPQHRERLLIVGLKEGVFYFPRPTHGPDSLDGQSFYNAETALEGVPLTEEESKPGIGGRYGALLYDIPPGLNYSFYTEEMGHPHPVFAWRSKFSDFLYKADPNQPVRTIKASGGAYTGPLHWNNRFFSYGEYKRLQTFPDDYEISGTKQTAVKQIGNSVPPQLARMMAIAIRQQVFHTEFPFELSLLDDSEQLTFRKRKRELTAIYRKKAECAIASLKAREPIHPASRTYMATISDDFNFAEAKPSDAKYIVHADWDKKLTITISEAGAARRVEPRARVLIESSNAIGLGIGVADVEIDIFSDDLLAFTAGWKAFERELIDNGIKADLIQLNGYYQYPSRLKCMVEFINDTPLVGVLRSIVSGRLVAQIVDTQTLAEAWNVPPDEVIETAEQLRALGYEIRNHRTNPQIPEGQWLVPYAFPTLTRQSVQLRKKLK